MRHFDHVDRLWQTINARQRFPFRWGAVDGAQDCCTFVASCVDAMTGSNFVEQMLARYHDSVSAQACINEAGGLAALVTQYLPTKPLARMGMGDVALCQKDGREFLGICVRDRIIAATEKGLGELPKKHAVACWGVS